MPARILIAKGNETNRQMLSRRLQRRDYVVEGAVGGLKDLEMLRVTLPDLISMDLRLLSKIQRFPSSGSPK